VVPNPDMTDGSTAKKKPPEGGFILNPMIVDQAASTCTTERAQPLKCLGSELQGKLTCGKLLTECRSLSGI